MAEAKDHHYIPRMILRRFTPDPKRKDSPLHRLSLPERTIDRRSAKNAASKRHLYRLEGSSDPLAAEDVLSRIESDAARVIRSMENRNLCLMPQARLDMAMFVATGFMRTPMMIDWITRVSESAYLMQAAMHLDRPDDPSDPQNEIRKETLASLRDGRVRITPTQNQRIGQILEGGQDLAPIAYAMGWELLRAPEGAEFVTGDGFLTLDDKGRMAARGSQSFPQSEVVVVLDPAMALRLHPTEQSQAWISEHDLDSTLSDVMDDLSRVDVRRLWIERDATIDEVSDLNLRYLVQSDEWVFSRSPETLAKVQGREAADPDRVAQLELRPRQMILLNDGPPIGMAQSVLTVVSTPKRGGTSVTYPWRKQGQVERE